MKCYNAVRAEVIFMELQIRLAGTADKAMLTEITEPSYHAVLADFSIEKLYIAFSDAVPVGWLYLRIPDNPRDESFLFVYVIPDRRKMGIGAELFRYAETHMTGCTGGWWTSYPEYAEADRFAMQMGADYTNTNSYMVYRGGCPDLPEVGIRLYREETDFPAGPEIWSREYAAMHIRLGLPWEMPGEKSEAELQEIRELYRELATHTYIIEENGNIAGIGGLFEHGGGIGMLAVDSKFTGKGYGTRLAAYLTKESIRRGCEHPHLYCEAGNDNAMHIYRKIGYVEENRETVAIKL